MKRVFTSVIVLIFSITAAAAVEQANPQRFAELIQSQDTVLVDVRTANETATAKIEGALEIDFFSPNLKEKLAELPKDKTLLIYCRSGNRSAKVVEILVDAGYPDIVNLAGGMLSWQRAKLPTVSSRK